LVVRSSPHHKEHRVSTNQPRPTKAQRREAARLKAKELREARTGEIAPITEEIIDDGAGDL